MYPGIWDQIGLKLVQSDVQRALEEIEENDERKKNCELNGR